jgi:hypothetical protein
MFTNETETREKIKSKMSLISEIIILERHSHESGNLHDSILWIPVFTGMTSETLNQTSSILSRSLY